MRSTGDGSTSLHFAAEFGRHEIVATLLSNGADKDAADNDGFTLLMPAAGQGHVAAAETLLAADANLKRRSADGLHLSAFDLAALNGHTRVMEAVLRHEEDVMACSDETGQNTLHKACYSRPEGLQGVVDLLLKHGADETAMDKNGDRLVDKLDIPLDEEEFEGPPPCAQDKVERARLLLARASADRAWRRRSWLVMPRSRAAKATGEEQERTPEEYNAIESGVLTVAVAGLSGQEYQERGVVGKIGGIQHGAPGGTAGCGSGFVGAAQAVASLGAKVKRAGGAFIGGAVSSGRRLSMKGHAPSGLVNTHTVGPLSQQHHLDIRSTLAAKLCRNGGRSSAQNKVFPRRPLPWVARERQPQQNEK